MTTNDRSTSDPLRALANRWALKARDHARQSKASADERLSSYHRGIAETYHRAAMELADELQSGTVREVVAPAAVTGSLPATKPMKPSFGDDEQPAEPPPVKYAVVPVGEVIRMLDYAGINARDVNKHDDNVYTAIFSRWQPYSDDERLTKLRAADLRIVVLATGKLRDTMDPYIDFAFREQV